MSKKTKTTKLIDIDKINWKNILMNVIEEIDYYIYKEYNNEERIIEKLIQVAQKTINKQFK